MGGSSMNRTWGMLKWFVVGASALGLSACAGFVPPAGVLPGAEIRAVESQASSSSQDASSSADSSQAEMEFTGAVVSIDPSAWVVGDQTVAVTDATEIKDAIVVGDNVKVHARPQADGP